MNCIHCGNPPGPNSVEMILGGSQTAFCSKKCFYAYLRSPRVVAGLRSKKEAEALIRTYKRKRVKAAQSRKELVSDEDRCYFFEGLGRKMHYRMAYGYLTYLIAKCRGQMDGIMNELKAFKMEGE